MKKVFLLAVLAIVSGIMYAGTRTEMRVLKGDVAAYSVDVSEIDSIVFVDIHFPEHITSMFLVGDATPGGWNIGQASPMNMDANDSEHFMWTGTLVAGELKFLTTNQDWFPCFVRDADDSTKIRYREVDQDYPDYKWEIAEEGKYTVDVNIRDYTISITRHAPEVIDPIYMIGDATAGGWFVESATPMDVDADDSEHFVWSGTLSVGEFKLLTSNEAWLPCYVRDDKDPTKMHFRETEDAYPDYKWQISATGDYTIDVNTRTLTILVTSHADVANAVPDPVSTDKAAYLPGEAVTFTLKELPANLQVRYMHLGQVVAQQQVGSLTWTWQPPTDDFHGYMAELFVSANGRDSVIAAIGIDVSSQPSRYPRNGFLSSFSNMSDAQINSVLNLLRRYHINYLQFQDWHWKHHHPLAGNAAHPMDEWKDILDRNCYRKTIQDYIDGAHARGMLTLYYNLANGCLEDYAQDGVSPEWMMYTDKQHTSLDSHTIGEPFKSNIFLANLHSQGWRDYIRARNDEVYSVFNFDGWQIDQLGPRPTEVYDYDGNQITVWADFGSFIADEKTARPDKRLAMNAVWQFGQYGQIAPSPVDFCYTEVWEHSDTDGYKVFSDIITDNTEWSEGKQTVLAAYMNYNLALKGKGYFNTPGVLMATAAASAWGGTILQMGEHMLCHEYFPLGNLSMTDDLQRAMIRYYDFAVAYEELLRPDMPQAGANTDWFGVDVTSTREGCTFNQWKPQLGQIATVGRQVGNRDVIHLLSYRNAKHLDWCDTNGDQPAQTLLTDIPLSINLSARPQRVWVATPDYRQGAAQTIDWEYADGKLTFNLPALQYWTMIVVEK